jgi:secreted PhoX family phosphatase
MKRRELLRGLMAAGALPALDGVLGPLARARADESPFARFDPIAPSDLDDIVLPPGFRYDVVIKWGDPFTREGRLFGYNNDFIGAFPLGDDEQALLVVNHEYISGIVAATGEAPLYPQTYRMLHDRAPTIEDYKRDLGVSVLRVRRDGVTGAWRPVDKDRLNRRIDAFTPCDVSGPAARLMNAHYLEGTFDNCAGQVTPWSTALSCEENFDQRVPAEVDTRGRFRRGGLFNLPGGHYGWVVEVDPFDPGSSPVKHTALGRFRHENVGLRAEPGRRVAGYMGDDRVGGHVWKFVSDGRYRPGDTAGNRRLLTSGRLYGARFNADGTGEWRRLHLGAPLDPNPDPNPKPVIPRGARKLGHVYATQGAALMDAYRAGNAIGATPSGRPEDLEVHPADGSVFVAFTLNTPAPDLFDSPYGEVWRIEEEGGDVTSTRFRWSRFCVGGPAEAARAGRVIAHPDNMLLDGRGDLWVACDIPGEKLNTSAEYRVFKNSGLFRVPVSGPLRGQPAQFASMPCEVEPTGPAFAPREQALFLSIQHPGEMGGIRREESQTPRGSNWPHRTLGAPPQPAVVAIRRA